MFLSFLCPSVNIFSFIQFNFFFSIHSSRFSISLFFLLLFLHMCFILYYAFHSHTRCNLFPFFLLRLWVLFFSSPNFSFQDYYVSLFYFSLPLFHNFLLLSRFLSSFSSFKFVFLSVISRYSFFPSSVSSSFLPSFLFRTIFFFSFSFIILPLSHLSFFFFKSAFSSPTHESPTATYQDKHNYI